MFRTAAAALSAALMLATPVLAQNDDTPEIPEAGRWESTGQVNAGGERVRYRAIAAETYLENEDGEPTG